MVSKINLHPPCAVAAFAATLVFPDWGIDISAIDDVVNGLHAKGAVLCYHGRVAPSVFILGAEGCGTENLYSVGGGGASSTPA